MARDSNALTGAALILALGLAASAYLIGSMQKEIRLADRVVTVKGLVERDVVADTSLWPLNASAAGNDLTSTQTQMEKNVDAIKRFLLDKGFKEEEISLSPVRVIDRQAMEYNEQKAGQARYVIQNTVTLRSTNIELVRKTTRYTNELVRAGITLSDTQGCNGPAFLFTGLNAIKPEMLVEATQNARKAAEQFAADSGSKVGGIKRAQQGVFSIAERDRAAAGDGDNDYNRCNADPNKKVRVVTTVDYYLE